MRPAAIIVESAMLLATPVGGGHYFVDVFAGMGVGVVAIAAACWIGERVMRPAAQLAPAQAASEPLPEPAAQPAA